MDEFRENGFTLVEVLLASVIGLFIAVVAVGALRVISSAAAAVQDNISTASEVRFAADIISRDLRNLFRDPDITNMRLMGELEESGQGSASRLVFYTVGMVKARAGQPEGDVYEVEYFLQRSRDGDRPVLFRRICPNPCKDVEPGGVLTAIAEDIDVFEVRFFDGEQWHLEWPEETRYMPDLVELTVASGQSKGRESLSETRIVNFARAVWGRTNEVAEGEKEKPTEEKSRPER